MFQNQINLVQAPGVEGDFASANPSATALTIPGGLVAGVSGVRVGRFAWIGSDNITAHTYGSPLAGTPRGFVARQSQALITDYLGEASMVVPVGFPVTIHSAGDFFVKNAGPGSSSIGQQVYARYSDGAAFFGSAPGDAAATGLIGSTNTAILGSTFTATGTGTSLVVTGITGYLHVGDQIAGNGVTAGTTITAQTVGTTGSNGTYTTSAATTSAGDTLTSFGKVMKVTATTGLISVGDTVSGGAGFPVAATVVSLISAGIWLLSANGSAYTASAAGVTTFGTVLDITAVASGTLLVGQPVSGTGVPTNAVITAQLSGTAGDVGTYRISVAASAYAASTAITSTGGVSATGWKAATVAAVGELVKISTWPVN